MPLFQRAPRTSEELEQAKPLETTPDQVLAMSEEEWYANIYRGPDVPQLTLRAVLMGSVLGFLLAFTNLYVGLKTGWALGVAITASILAFSIWTFLLKVGIARTQMTILEMNCMQSTASSAGYATGGIMVSAIAALLMLSANEENQFLGEHLPVGLLLSWTFVLGVMGTVMAIPMKRRMINRERLKFPTGTAAAVTLQSLYSAGDLAIKKAKALFLTAGVGTIFPLLIDLNVRSELLRDGTARAFRGVIPGHSNVFDFAGPISSHVERGTGGRVSFLPSQWLLYLDHNPVMIAAGMLVGLRITIWMTVSSLFLAFLVGPMAYDAAWISEATGETLYAATLPQTAWKEIGIWLGVPIMVAASLLAFALQGKTILRAFSKFEDEPGGTTVDPEVVRATEPPSSWFFTGTLLAGLAVISIANFAFGVPFVYGAIAVAMTFVLCLVACRATGESDITPTGAMGKIMQLTYGVALPQNATANLMTAGITASAAGSAADLLNDLKSGYLLGANPRRQFLAQLIGVFSGTLATVFGFYLLVGDATLLNGTPDGGAPEYPAPAAQSWKAVADVFVLGLGNMHPWHRTAIFIGLAIGAVIGLGEELAPKWKKWIPSTTGLGLGLILPFQYPLSMLIGAIAAYVWTKLDKKSADNYVVIISAGLIAGISIVGVLVQILNVTLFP